MNTIEIRSESEKLREELKKIGHTEDRIEELTSALESVLEKGLKFDYTDFVAPIAPIPPI